MQSRILAVCHVWRGSFLALLPAALACSGPPIPSGDPATEPAPTPAPVTNAPPAMPTLPNAAPRPASTPSTSEGVDAVDLLPPVNDGSAAGGDGGSGGEQTGEASPENEPPIEPSLPPSPSVPAGGDDCPPPDELFASLQSFASDDDDLAEAFADYLGEEVGLLACATSGNGGSRTITQTIVVPPNTTYDGRGEVLTADATAMNCDLTAGEQGESQRPYFLLAPGAGIRNVTINFPGCDGIHMMGNNILENITWVDVGEDAASVRSYFPGGIFAILDSRADHAFDKVFQFNAPGALLIQNFVGADIGKLVLQNGGTDFELRVDLNHVAVSGVTSAVVQSDSPECFVRHHNLSFAFVDTDGDSDRVFLDIPDDNVTEY